MNVKELLEPSNPLNESLTRFLFVALIRRYCSYEDLLSLSNDTDENRVIRLSIARECMKISIRRCPTSTGTHVHLKISTRDILRSEWKLAIDDFKQR